MVHNQPLTIKRVQVFLLDTLFVFLLDPEKSEVLSTYTWGSKKATRNQAVGSSMPLPVPSLSCAWRLPQLRVEASRPPRHRTQIYVFFPGL